MNKAFIFDMDGVLIDTEKELSRFDPVFLSSILPKDIYEKIGDTMGMSIKAVYDKAVAYGASIDLQSYTKAYNDAATSIYAKAPVADDADKLVAFLIERDFRLGLVTGSQQESINKALPRFPFREKFDVIISTNDRQDLKQKPHPDGYLEALRCLDAEPKHSIIMEDSNLGIMSGKAAGAYVIGFRAYLSQDYEQTGADADADTMEDVIKLVESFDRD